MAAGDISIRFAAEGDQTLKSAISAIDAELKALNEGVKSSTEAMKGMGDQEAATAQKNELLAKSVEANKEKLSLLSRQYDDAKGKLQGLAEQMEEARKSGDPAAIDKATTAYNRQSVEVSKLEGAMARAQGEINRANNEMQNGGKESESFGEKVGKLADQMQIKLAGDALKGVVDGLEKFGSMCVSVGKQIWSLASDSSTMADDLITLSTKTGISAEKLQEYAYAARFVDTEVSTITGSMVKLTKNMSSTSESTAEAFKKLGVSVTDSKGNMKDAEKVFWQAIDALGKVKNETERDQIAMTLFGKSAQDLNPLIKAGSKAWNEYAQEAKDAGLVISDEGVGALGSFNDGLQRVDATMDAVKNQLMAALAPAFTTVANAVADAAQKFTKWIQSTEAQNHLKEIADLVTNLASKFLDNLGPAVEKGIEMFKNVGGAVEYLSTHINQIVGVIQTVVTVFIALKTAMAGLQIAALVTNPIGAAIAAVTAIIAAIVLLIQNWDKVKEAGKKAWEVIESAWKGAVSWFKNIATNVLGAFNGIGDKIAGFFSGAWTKIKTAWSSVGSFFGNIVTTVQSKFSNIGTTLASYFQNGWNAIKTAWSSVGNWFKNIATSVTSAFNGIGDKLASFFTSGWSKIKSAWSSVTSYFTNIANSVRNAFSNIGTTLGGYFSTAWRNIQNAFGTVKSYFSGKANDIRNAFSSIPSNMSSIGRQIVEGIWNGISSMIGWITNKIGNFSNSVVSSFKAFFGIRSPSTVMRDEVGKYIGEGIGEGILDEKGFIQRAVDKVMPDVSGISNGLTMAASATEPTATQPIYLQVDGQTFARLMTGYIDQQQGENWTQSMALGLA